MIGAMRSERSSLCFVGGGRITSALIAGLRLADDRRRIVVHDRNPAKLQTLRRPLHAEVARNLKTAVESAEMLVLAVRPASVTQALREIADSGARVPRISISLAAGIPLSRLNRERIGGSATRWLRAMPSPVCRIGRGLTALSFDRRVSFSDRRKVKDLFSRVGSVIEVSEDAFDAFTATYSSSHGYHALAALSEAARSAGLNQQTALIAAAHALGDAILYWRESGLSVEDLLHEAATPGGIAAATMSAMDRAGYKRAVARGLNAGIAQAKRNART